MAMAAHLEVRLALLLQIIHGESRSSIAHDFGPSWKTIVLINGPV